MLHNVPLIITEYLYIKPKICTVFFRDVNSLDLFFSKKCLDLSGMLTLQLRRAEIETSNHQNLLSFWAAVRPLQPMEFWGSLWKHWPKPSRWILRPRDFLGFSSFLMAKRTYFVRGWMTIWQFLVLLSTGSITSRALGKHEESWDIPFSPWFGFARAWQPRIHFQFPRHKSGVFCPTWAAHAARLSPAIPPCWRGQGKRPAQSPRLGSCSCCMWVTSSGWSWRIHTSWRSAATSTALET